MAHYLAGTIRTAADDDAVGVHEVLYGRALTQEFGV